MEPWSKEDFKNILSVIGGLIKIPARRFWVDYDEEADVLYLSCRKPQRASESELGDDGIIVRTKGKEVVGLTILDASTRSNQSKEKRQGA